MDLFALARRLIDIESITPNESAVGDFLCDELQRRGMEAQKMPVEGARANVLATWPGHARPEIVFSTHMDTVPPFITSSENGGRIYGRGACDAKGIIAAQILAAEKLRGAGVFAGLLFLVGEERDSIGAKEANQQPIGARFMINGEPTENKLALASKGALHVELVARGKMAHSAYPELGESAIDKLVEALHRLHAMKLPEDAEVGACTKNVGAIQGGRAPNVISDFAKADLFYRRTRYAARLRRPSASSPRSDSRARLRSCGCGRWTVCRRWSRLSRPTSRRCRIGANRCCWDQARFTWRTQKASLWRRSSWWKRWRFIVRWRKG